MENTIDVYEWREYEGIETQRRTDQSYREGWWNSLKNKWNLKYMLKNSLIFVQIKLCGKIKFFLGKIISMIREFQSLKKY